MFGCNIPGPCGYEVTQPALLGWGARAGHDCSYLHGRVCSLFLRGQKIIVKNTLGRQRSWEVAESLGME